ncbi:hypothetical protein LXL04_026612 [Taraxacum kok-saghyz]
MLRVLPLWCYYRLDQSREWGIIHNARLSTYILPNAPCNNYNIHVLNPLILTVTPNRTIHLYPLSLSNSIITLIFSRICHMSTCVSSHQKPSAMKVQALCGSDDMKLVKPPIINGDLPAKPHSAPPASFRDFGSKEETFFDSQAWLESDCDDDFKSVNGDFTPSRGNTPVHHKFSAANNKPPLVIRLQTDSLRGSYKFENEEKDDDKNGKVESSPVVNGGGNGLKTKSRLQGCFPGLLYTRSSSRKMMSPNPNPVVG